MGQAVDGAFKEVAEGKLNATRLQILSLAEEKVRASIAAAAAPEPGP